MRLGLSLAPRSGRPSLLCLSCARAIIRGMARTLGKLLSTPTTKVNNQVGNPRRGKTYIEAKDENGNIVHRYGVEEGRDDIAWNSKSARSPEVKVTATQTATANATSAASAAASAAEQRQASANQAATKAKGGLVNQIKGSARYGKSYKNVTRGGLSGHLYADGTFVAMGKKSARKP